MVSYYNRNESVLHVFQPFTTFYCNFLPFTEFLFKVNRGEKVLKFLSINKGFIFYLDLD